MAGEVLWRQTVHVLTERLRPGNAEWQMLVWPPVAYWLVACYFDVLDRLRLPITERYKVVRRDPGRPNALTVRHVVMRVLLQQALQALFNVAIYIVDPETCERCLAAGNPMLRVARFILGMYVMDAWQYFIHRFFHTVPYLYKLAHATHHTLLAPYAYGALYNTVLEGLALDTLGGGVTLWVTGLDCQTAALLFTFATVKTVCDHSNYRAPFNLLHPLFPNSAAFHDVHHDLRYIKTNFSQPFFTHWDFLLGTFVDPATVHLSSEEMKERVEQQRRDGRKAKAQ